MSRFVDEIIKSLETEPTQWRQGIYVGHIIQLSKGKIVLWSFGNGRATSIMNVEIRGVEAKTTWSDRWRLEGAISRWYQSIALNDLVYEIP